MKPNYIHHFKVAWQKLSEKNQLDPHHLSIYVTLFHLWNKARFINPMGIDRREIMWLSKVRSNAKYISCMRQLDTFGFIRYLPSKNAHAGSKVRMVVFGKSDNNSEANSANKSDPNSDENSDQGNTLYINRENKTNSKREETPPTPTLQEIMIFFKKEGLLQNQAEAFFHHYQANGWLQGGKTPIQNWQAAANSWIVKEKNFKTHNFKNNNSHGNTSNTEFGTGTAKNFAEPL